MPKTRLYLRHIAEIPTQPLSGDAVKFQGGLWSLHGIYNANHPTKGEVLDLHVECRSVDKNVIYEYEVEVDILAEVHNTDEYLNLSSWKFELNNDAKVRSESLSSVWDIIDCPISRMILYVADIEIKSIKTYQKLKFEFKNPNLTDIRFIVGDKTFYASKQILALNSKKFMNEEIDRIEDVSSEVFNKFLGVLYGYNCPNLKVSEFHDFVKLSISFDAHRCLEHCEKSFWQMSGYDRMELSSQFDRYGLDICKNYLESLFRASDHSPAPVQIMEVFENFEDVEKLIQIEGVPFKIMSQFMDNSEIQKVTIQCLYKGAQSLWEFRTLISYTNDRTAHSSESSVFHAISRFFFPKVANTDSSDIFFSLNFTSSKNTKTILVPWKNGTRTKISMHLTSSRGQFPEEVVNFDIPSNLTDVTLSVGDKEYHVNRQVLAHHCNYFNTLFYSNFAEKEQKVIKIQGIGGEFEEFLQHVYNPKRIFKETTFEQLLQLSQYYDADYIHKKCVQFIELNEKLNDAQKLRLSLKYHLNDLFKKCVAKITTFEEFVRVSRLEGFQKIDKQTILQITEKLMINY